MITGRYVPVINPSKTLRAMFPAFDMLFFLAPTKALPMPGVPNVITISPFACLW